MKMLFRLMIAMMIFSLGTAVFAEGFQMDRITLATKHVEDEDDQYWLYFNSNANYDWMRMNLQGKFYFEDLDENWVDYSPYGMGDLYSGLKANFKFPELSKGLNATLGYKWNENFQIYLYGLGYGWNPVKNLNLGVRYDAARREDKNSNSNGEATLNPDTGEIMNEEDHDGDLDRRQQEFFLDFSPKNWGYSLNVKRIERDFLNPSTATEGSWPYSQDYSSLSYIYDHKLSWQATSKLTMGLRYVTTASEYDDSKKIDGDNQKWTVDGTYVLNNQWTWSGAYSQSDYTGYDGKTDSDRLSLKGKYTSNSNWWYAAKLYMYDLNFDQDYYKHYNNVNDKDADYNTRTQNVIAFEFEQKLKPFNYNIEVFAKNFDYEVDPVDKDRDNGTKAGIIGTIVWDWMNLRWSFRAAPNGDLSTRKANYELKATYKFK